MRLVAVVTQKYDADISWNIVNQSIWATVEADFVIISGALPYFPSIKTRIQVLITTACLPTLQPVWVTIRKKSSHAEQSSSSYQHLAGTTPPKRTPSSWATLILGSKANYEEEDSLPVTAVHGPTEDPLHSEAVQELQTSSITTSIPLSDIPTGMVQSPHTIRIKNTLDVEYSQEVQHETHT
ncbi:hypothetical protein F4813DRAFT_385035 [Daldinia decipiens]|uniref:uncharacterized protein n=1 Tax=Daldinia decipiens TaxID=326647 RepID=UPI0020C4DC2E|nr:uncharacterized protein F4813DRAFT_385035 [Daldinia decipiens]KAI1662322.1 hypothetical protein F4813DRAFT_385035 [Daldinia decipiens]